MNTKSRTYFLLALLAVSAGVSFLVLQPFLATAALAAIFAVVLAPLHRRVLSGMKGRPSLAALATLVLGCFFVLVPVSLLSMLIIGQSQNAYHSFVDGTFTAEKSAVALGTWLEPSFPGATEYAAGAAQELNAYLQQGFQWVLERAGSAFTSVFGFFIRLIIFLIALYYFLRDGTTLRKFIITHSPLKGEEGAAILNHLGRTVNSVVRGSLVIAGVQGTLAGLGYAIFGVPNAIIWGVCTAVSALIPGVGTSLVLVPATIFLFVSGNVGGGIGLALWGLFLVGLIDNFLAPRLIGRGAQLHPLLILLAVVGGVALYGPAGIFLGPLTVSFLLAVFEVYAKQG